MSSPAAYPEKQYPDKRLIIHFLQPHYPFFQFAPRYTTATGESIIEGYRRLGKPFIIFYIILTLATMFTIQAAVTMVTAGLAQYLFGISESIVFWSIVITVISVLFLIAGKYTWLDKLMKFIILLLTISSLVAVVSAAWHTDRQPGSFFLIPQNAGQVAFLIAFLGWMPAPLDVSVWQSLWAEEKQKQIGTTFDTRQSIFDEGLSATYSLCTG